MTLRTLTKGAEVRENFHRQVGEERHGLAVRAHIASLSVSFLLSLHGTPCPCHLHQGADTSLLSSFACIYHTGYGWLLQPQVHLHCTAIALGLPP